MSDRLSPLDVTFLELEDGRAHMHVGAVLVFEGEAPQYDDFVAAVERGLELVPRYRQRLAWPPGGLARPCWVDDPRFAVRFHVRHAGLPAPGSETELRELAGLVFGEPLDRRHPLWELWLIDGLEGGRFALISKTHHALADGISGVDLMAALLDLDATPARIGDDDEPASPPKPAVLPPPGDAKLLADATRDQMRDAMGAARTVAAAAKDPSGAATALLRTLRGGGELAGTAGDPAPPSPYNRRISGHRRFAWARASLAEVQAIKDRLGVSVNDVVLAAVAGALRRDLHRRGADLDELRAMVPVSLRDDTQRGTYGNRITAIYAPLPVGLDDPLERVRAVAAAMADRKQGDHVAGAEALVQLGAVAPRAVLSLAAKGLASRRVFNLTVTNVPGPQVPLYLLGRRLRDVFPLVPLAPEHALGLAIMSYDGRLGVGVLGCWESVDGLDAIAADVRSAFSELRVAAGAPRERPRRRFAPRPPTQVPAR